MNKYTCMLIISIFWGLCGQTFLNYSKGFTHLLFTALCLSSYFLAFTFLAFSMKKIPLSIAYAVWGGVGACMSVVIGFFLFSESLSVLKVISISMIGIGIVLLHLSGAYDTYTNNSLKKNS